MVDRVRCTWSIGSIARDDGRSYALSDAGCIASSHRGIRAEPRTHLRPQHRSLTRSGQVGRSADRDPGLTSRGSSCWESSALSGCFNDNIISKPILVLLAAGLLVNFAFAVVLGLDRPAAQAPAADQYVECTDTSCHTREGPENDRDEATSSSQNVLPRPKHDRARRALTRQYHLSSRIVAVDVVQVVDDVRRDAHIVPSANLHECSRLRHIHCAIDGSQHTPQTRRAILLLQGLLDLVIAECG